MHGFGDNFSVTVRFSDRFAPTGMWYEVNDFNYYTILKAKRKGPYRASYILDGITLTESLHASIDFWKQLFI